MNDEEMLRRLRRLIGRECLHLGRRCLLVEVLADEGTLVLRCLEGTPPIQGDQFGQPLRRASETRQIRLFTDGGDGITDEALDLLAAFGPGTG